MILFLRVIRKAALWPRRSYSALKLEFLFVRDWAEIAQLTLLIRHLFLSA
jgi:hypothetical protein